TAAAFEATRDDRTALRAFLHRMPKGGDLHTHLSGAVYAERFIAWAAEQGLCVDLRNVVLAKSQCDGAAAVPVSDAIRDQTLYNRMVDAFSMRWFLPTPAVPTGHDEFFAAFEKFGTVSGSHFVDMTVDQLKLYDSQNVQYVEFMVSSWCPNDRERFVKAVSETTDDASKLAALQASGLGDCVAATRNGMTAPLGTVTPVRAGAAARCTPAWGLPSISLPRTNRNNPLAEAFFQPPTAAPRTRAEPRTAPPNFAGPEKNFGARRASPRHMQIIRFLAN